MATTRPADQVIQPANERRAITGLPADSVRLDWIIALSSSVNVFGLFIDGWAHNHGFVDDTFFTPWHAVLYGAIAFAGLALIVTHFRNVGRGYRWSRALPAGYGLSLIGFFAFATGGLGDLLWHETFGFESGLETLLSPSHLFLALSALLIISGPIRAMWNRQTDPSWRSLAPVILSFICITSIFTFFCVFAAITGNTRMLTGPKPSGHVLQDIAGIMAFVLHTNILLAVVLFMRRRWKLPFGAITLLFVLNSLLMIWYQVEAYEEFAFTISALTAGLLADFLLSRAGKISTARLRVSAILIPFTYSLGAMIIVHILGTTVWSDTGLWWEIHMWLGVPVLAGAFGYGLSLLFRPPAISAELRA